jgi:hypothetical protein
VVVQEHVRVVRGEGSKDRASPLLGFVFSLFGHFASFQKLLWYGSITHEHRASTLCKLCVCFFAQRCPLFCLGVGRLPLAQRHLLSLFPQHFCSLRQLRGAFDWRCGLGCAYRWRWEPSGSVASRLTYLCHAYGVAGKLPTVVKTSSGQPALRGRWLRLRRSDHRRALPQLLGIFGAEKHPAAVVWIIHAEMRLQSRLAPREAFVRRAAFRQLRPASRPLLLQRQPAPHNAAALRPQHTAHSNVLGLFPLPY